MELNRVVLPRPRQGIQIRGTLASSLVTEGSGKPVPDPGPTLCSTTEEAGASTSHPGHSGVNGGTLRTPIAGFSQMLGATGAVDNPDVYVECDVALKEGPDARPTQPPHPQRIADVPTGDPVDLELYGSPDTVDIEDIFSVDVTPLSSISTSGPDKSVIESVSVDRGTLMSVDFDDHSREIQDSCCYVRVSRNCRHISRRRRRSLPKSFK